MNDPKLLREAPEQARQGVRDRSGRYLPYLEAFLKEDAAHRALLQEVEALRARKNTASEAIGKARAAKDDAQATGLMDEVSRIKARIKERGAALEAASARIREAQLSIPNIPHETCPIGKSEVENVERRKSSRLPKQFDFQPRDHQSLGEQLGILDMKTAAKLSGARFSLLKGAGARLERALAAFMLDLHTRKHGYLEIRPPYLVRPEILEGTGQLPKFQEDMYATASSSSEDKTPRELYLVSTAEIPLTNLVRDDILDAAALPLKYSAHTPCFRQEAGSYGKDTRGLIRVHQFDKVELVWITRPEDSMSALEELTRHAAAVLDALEIPYRVVELCTADLGFASCKTYDIELWLPSEGRYREVSSCSNCWDFQARRMNARFRRGGKGAPEFVHTLNGSGLAVGRAFAAVLENFQQKDGSVTLPQALVPYFGAATVSRSGIFP